jgi:folate-binding protein YgfZ
VLVLDGEDRVAFLQGITSNDIDQVAANRAVFSAFLTAQGKFLHDFFVIALGDSLLLDCDADRRDDLFRRLRIYRLRSKVEIADATAQYAVAVAFGEGAAQAVGLSSNASPGEAVPFAGGIAYRDPRLPALGIRVVAPHEGLAETLRDAGLADADAAAYDSHRLALGVPEGGRDLLVEKSTLLESNYDTLNAISWDKGCYLGQELTARMKYRGLVKKRLMPVTVDGTLPAAGTPITFDGRDVGEMRSGRDGLAIALLRLDAVAKAAEQGASALTAEGATITVRDAAWMRATLPSES